MALQSVAFQNGHAALDELMLLCKTGDVAASAAHTHRTNGDQGHLFNVGDDFWQTAVTLFSADFCSVVFVFFVPHIETQVHKDRCWKPVDRVHH